MQVFGYIRVSTAEQAANGDSLATQRRQLEGHAMVNGWSLGEVFVEAGVSGSVPLAERPEGERLLAAARKGDVIITAKLDRMFRSAADALSTLEAMKAEGVALHMIDLGGDVCGNGISKLVFTILSAVAENERDRIRERVRDVKRHLASQGIYSGGKRPFGYDIVKSGENDPPRLVPNPVEQRQLAKMRKMRAEGASYPTIGETIGKPAMSVKRILDRAESARLTAAFNAH